MTVCSVREAGREGGDPVVSGRCADPWRRAVALAVLVIALALSIGAEPAPGRSTLASGGRLTIVSPRPREDLSLDPALSIDFFDAALHYATCATLTAFRDAPAPKGYTVRPEAAVGPPLVLDDGRTYVFTVRKGLHFSDGSALTAANFKLALDRVRNPVVHSLGADLFSDVRRVSASGWRLRIQLRKPSGDLITRLALPYACPVPRPFPIDPVGTDLKVGSGPYYVSHDAPLLVLDRNPYYHGSLPHRVDQIVVDFGGDLDSAIAAVEHGQADMVGSEIPGDRAVELAGHGVDRRQLIRLRGISTEALVLNMSSRLFRGNVRLRKAINFALDRPAVIAQTPGGPRANTPTDQVVPRRSPGWVDYYAYPLAGPDLKKARRLAAGHLRGGRAVLYAPDDRLRPDAAAEIADDLHRIGLKVVVTKFAAPVLMDRVGTRGEPFDMALGNWGDDVLGPVVPDLDAPILYPDPANTIVRYLGGQNARRRRGNTNIAYFDVPAYNRRMTAAASLSGPSRFRAFSLLDKDIMRNEAPWAPIAEGSSWTFIGSRVGCFRRQPVVHWVLGDLCFR
jgi:peptide/nickel transport system substrate-binding protein